MIEIIIAFLFSAVCITSAVPVDSTLSRNAMGADVVRAVFSRMDEFNLFDSPSSSESERQDVELFMRELAYVESGDGTDFPLGVRDGGIWRISRDLFDQTQNYPYPQLFDDICRALCVNWMTVQYSDLAMPLYSGLAARIHLFHLYNTSRGLPGSATDTNIAIFWANAFGGNRLVSTWLFRVEQLRRVEVCLIDTDVMFVLDASGSIGASDFQTVRDFTYNYTEGLFSGGSNSRVGVILYSDIAHVQIPLEYISTNGPSALLEEISDLPYLNGYTNTPEGLCLLNNVTWRPSISVLKLAIVLTDGLSNRLSQTCTTPDGSRGTVSSTANEIHDLDPPVTVFALGVANYRLEELKIIATSENLVDVIESFDYRQLLQNQRSRTYYICFKESQPAKTQEEQTGEVGMGTVSRLEFTGPGREGLSIRICVNQGVIVVYGSYTSPNPNSALHDFSEVLRAPDADDQVTPTRCLTSFTTQDDIDARRSEDENVCTACTPRRKKRQASEEREIVVYITIEGASDTTSQFNVNTSTGANYECAEDFCGVNEVLIHADGSCSCECAPGYKREEQTCISGPFLYTTPNLLTCLSLTEDFCGVNEVLIRADDSCFCECAPGYEREEHTCIKVIDEEEDDSNNLLNAGIYAAVVGVFCAAVLVVAVILVFVCVRFNRRRRVTQVGFAYARQVDTPLDTPVDL